MPTPTCPVDGTTVFNSDGANWRCNSCQIVWATEDLVDPRLTFLIGQYQSAWVALGRVDAVDDGGMT